MKDLRLKLCAFLMAVLAMGCNNEEKPRELNESKEVINIGAVLPLTGDVGKYGNWVKEGIDLAVEEINSTKYIGENRELKVFYEDDKCEAKEAASGMEKLTNINKVSFVIGSWCSSCVLAQAPIAEKQKVILFAEGLSPKISDAGDFIYRVISNGKHYADKILQYIYQQGYTNIAVIYVNNDFGFDIATYFQNQTNANNVDVELMAYEYGTKDFKTELLKIKTMNPDAILMISYEEAGYIIKQAKEFGVQSNFLAMDTYENEEIIRIAGAAASGVVYPHFFDPNRKGKQFVRFSDKYNQKYGAPPEGFAAVSYDAVYIIAESLKNSNSLDVNELLRFLNTMSYEGVTGKIQFDSKGDAIKELLLKTVRDKEFTTL